MSDDFAEIKSIHDFPSLVRYLRKDLGWPVDEEQVDDLTFEYTPQELGLDEDAAVKIREIKQLRPLTGNQPWGIFWIDFEPKRLPVMVMRRILAALVRKQRGGRTHQAAWDLRDLLFVSATGLGSDRGISFAHFQETEAGPQLRTFSWDAHETHFYYLENLNLKGLRWPENSADAAAWREQWSQAFTAAHRETITTSQALASRMARLASAIRLLVLQTLEAEKEGGPFHRLYAEFKRVLIHDLEADDFADMYAQTVTYGLFTARAMPFTAAHGAAPDLPFNLENVTMFIPPTNPFLRDLFAACIQADLDENEVMDLEGLGVGELVTMLQRANMEAILQDFGRQTRGEDPVIHFYESFLREYDPKKKVKRGVFYTPDPVVSFIVRSVDHLLRTEFGCKDGLATRSQTSEVSKTSEVFQPIILDPACGTGTFLKYVIEQVYSTFVARHKSKGQEEVHRLWNEYVPKHLLPRLYGFELLAAPYSVAHMKLGLKLRETGYDFGSDERLHVYLTNTLQWVDEVPRTETEFLAHEAEQASRVKSATPITVIIGNPPYSKVSANTGNWISNLLQGYYQVDGKPLGERNPKWLQDDYVKFFRFAQWRIQQTGAGVIGMITNHGYLNNPTFRGMRQQLLESFDTIYILDLHGNAKKQEVSPDGSKDENVFDIQQGVAICLMVRHSQRKTPHRVFHADFYGSREHKYEQLLLTHLDHIDWQEISPVSPSYLFIPQNVSILPEYSEAWLVTKMFEVYTSTVTTARNDFSMAYEPDTLVKRVNDLKDSSLSDENVRKKYGLVDVSYWKLADARKELSRVDHPDDFVRSYCYRPFDFRFVFYHNSVCERPRAEVMYHMKDGNLALLTHRPQSPSDFTFAYCTRMIGDQCVAANKSAGGGNSFQFPLYLFPDLETTHQKRLFSIPSISGRSGRHSNLSPQFIADVERKQRLKFAPDGMGNLYATFGPEDIFHYIYAVFHSPSYRQRYVEFLKIDFPRLPLTSNLDLFRQLCVLGAELVEMHLLEHPVLEKPITKFTGWAENGVAKGYPKYQDGTVFINEQQGFEGVPPEVWEFHVGGYQVCEKWLKDRRGRQLSPEDIAHYQKIVVALKETIRLMGEVDTAIESAGGWPMK